MTAVSATNPFLADSVLTASPARLLVMLYDRLARSDLQPASTRSSGNRAVRTNASRTRRRSATSGRRLDIEIWPDGGACSMCTTTC